MALKPHEWTDHEVEPDVPDVVVSVSFRDLPDDPEPPGGDRASAVPAPGPTLGPGSTRPNDTGRSTDMTGRSGLADAA